MSKFHLKVANCVDRILLFSNNDLTGEMNCVDSESEERIFNGEIDKTAYAVLLCYPLGESMMDARDVFSRPLIPKPADVNNDVMGNAICINYFNPKVDDATVAQICIVDIPERLVVGLGIPSTIILQKAAFGKDKTEKDIAKYGFDVKADGYFMKSMEHLWAIEDFEDEKITINLYAQAITKQIDV
jgi:hypothetical protein